MAERRTGKTIRTKLLISYLAIAALILVVGLIGIYNIHEVYSNGNEIYVNNLKSVEYLKSINQNVKEIDQCVVSMMSELDKDFHESYVNKVSQLQAENEVLMEEYGKLKVTSLEQRRYKQCRISILTFDKQIADIIERIQKGDTDGAVGAYEQELMPAKACTYELLEAVVELSTRNASRRNAENYDIYQNIIWLIGMATLFSVIITVIVSIRMSNYFTSKLGAIQRLARRISEYNISDDILAMADDEFGETMEALNDSQFMLRDLLEKIVEESASLADTGEEISLAVRKSSTRIETVNMQVLESGEIANTVDSAVHAIFEKCTVDEEEDRLLKEILSQSDKAQEILTKAGAELTSVAMYLEQIGITSDYQNEIANSHKEQVQRFKV